MNLKEAFRYQKFLSQMMDRARCHVENPQYIMKKTNVHLRHAANPEAEDVVEVVDVGEFVPIDTVLRFMQSLICEREKLTREIVSAKGCALLDIDTAVETNKFRQILAQSVRELVSTKETSIKSKGSDYKFDINGQQVQYMYDMEIKTEDNFDRAGAKTLLRSVLSKSDSVSSEIEEAMVNTVVYYEPPYDVNDSFDDVLEMFIQMEARSLDGQHRDEEQLPHTDKGILQEDVYKKLYNEAIRTVEELKESSQSD